MTHTLDTLRSWSVPVFSTRPCHMNPDPAERMARKSSPLLRVVEERGVEMREVLAREVFPAGEHAAEAFVGPDDLQAPVEEEARDLVSEKARRPLAELRGVQDGRACRTVQRPPPRGPPPPRPARRCDLRTDCPWLHPARDLRFAFPQVQRAKLRRVGSLPLELRRPEAEKRAGIQQLHAGHARARRRQASRGSARRPGRQGWARSRRQVGPPAPRGKGQGSRSRACRATNCAV